jgi:hypothetical protein
MRVGIFAAGVLLGALGSVLLLIPEREKEQQPEPEVSWLGPYSATPVDVVGPKSGGLISGSRPYIVGEQGPEVIVGNTAQADSSWFKNNVFKY